jgi:hypothetical protein
VRRSGRSSIVVWVGPSTVLARPLAESVGCPRISQCGEGVTEQILRVVQNAATVAKDPRRSRV